jgi:glycosyltransferase involved in cell wall biosynthesis
VARVEQQPTASDVDLRASAVRRVAIVPAFNEEDAVARVVQEIRFTDPDMEILVVDDGSRDGTAGAAWRAGATVLELPFNLGIGGAMQAGYRYALERGFDVAVQVDGDGQHDPAEMPRLLDLLLEGRADMVVGSRFLGDNGYRAPLGRMLGIRMFARIVSLIVGQRVTDSTSGFRAVNRRGIALFARDYPNDYPEVESTVLVYRHRLRRIEVPVRMRERSSGRSSITPFGSVYYVVKVTLALLVDLFRSPGTLPEEP